MTVCTVNVDIYLYIRSSQKIRQYANNIFQRHPFKRVVVNAAFSLYYIPAVIV